MVNMLKALREKNGMTQEELASAIGSNKAYISTLENGKRDITNIQTGTLTRLCTALHCTPEELYGVKFEITDDDRLVIDKLYWSVQISSYIVVIDNFGYIAQTNPESMSGKELVGRLKPILAFSKEVDLTDDATNYSFLPVVPRNMDFWEEYKASFHKVSLYYVREFCERHDIQCEAISEPFTLMKGGAFGKAFAYEQEYVQVTVPEFFDTYGAEHELIRRGFDVSVAGWRRLNIAVKR